MISSACVDHTECKIRRLRYLCLPIVSLKRLLSFSSVFVLLNVHVYYRSHYITEEHSETFILHLPP